MALRAVGSAIRPLLRALSLGCCRAQQAGAAIRPLLLALSLGCWQAGSAIRPLSLGCCRAQQAGSAIRPLLLVLSLGCCRAQQAGEAAATAEHTTNSVDIQVCATGVLADNRDSFQRVLMQKLETMLGGTLALFLEAMFTDAGGDICFRYVYQASSPAAAVQAFHYLNPSGVTTTMLVPFSVQGANAVVNCSLAAAQWNGYSLSYLGVPLPAQWSLDTLLLWGSCLAGALALCVAGACCFALRSATRREEDEALERIALMNRQLLKRMAPPSRPRHGRHSADDDSDDDAGDDGREKRARK